MDASEFESWKARGFNRIPVIVETLADLDTPLSTYLKLARGPFSYLLESYPGEEKWSRYSMIGLPARTVVRIKGPRIEVSTDGKVVEQCVSDDPLGFVESFQQRFRVAPVEGLPRFYGGLVGYFGYDTVRYVEKRLRDSSPTETLDTPDILLMLSEDVVVFDNVRGRMQLVSLVDVETPDALNHATERLRQRVRSLRNAIPAIPSATANQPKEERDFVSSFGEEQFRTAVERIREYIRAGDVMQVVLSQRMSIPFGAHAIDLYRALRSLNPSPYMYFMDLEDFEIVSSSPRFSPAWRTA